MKLPTSITTSDDSNGHRCPECLDWFRVDAPFPDQMKGFRTECPHCGNEMVYTPGEVEV